jgi:hypothetical protein
MKNEEFLEDFDYITNEENKESEQPFLQLEIPDSLCKQEKEYIKESKRVIIIEL